MPVPNLFFKHSFLIWFCLLSGYITVIAAVCFHLRATSLNVNLHQTPLHSHRQGKLAHPLNWSIINLSCEISYTWFCIKLSFLTILSCVLVLKRFSTYNLFFLQIVVTAPPLSWYVGVESIWKWWFWSTLRRYDIWARVRSTSTGF